MDGLHRDRVLLWTLLAVFLIVSFGVLGVRPLLPPDEGRYAALAHGMFASGDWITPRLNGIKYFEKPPLQPWMNALTFAAFGVGEWQARLWTGLCGAATVLLAGHCGARLFGARAGWYAALVLASSFFWVACSQFNSLDMGLAAMLALALCALLLAQRIGAGERERRNWMLACWAAMALAVLSKGLVGLLLPGATLVLYSLLARDWRIWTRLHAGKGAALFLALAVPWFVLVALRNPEQPWFFFVHEHFNRYLLEEHRRTAPWWTYFALLAAGMLPWAGALPQGLALGARHEPGGFRPRLLLLAWVAFVTLFFTLSSSKLPGYILPVFPAVALLVALHLDAAKPRALMLAAGLAALPGLALLAFAPFVPGLHKHAGEAALYQAGQPWVAAAGAAALLGAVLALLFARRMLLERAVLTLALSGFACAHLLLAGYAPLGKARAGVTLLPAIQAALTPHTRLYSVSLYEQSLTFYLGRPLTLVDYLDEFGFGLQQEPHLAIPHVHDFVQQWQRESKAGVPALAITRPGVVAIMRRHGAPLRIIAGDARRVVIVNN
jgi:4-amino-4-deoxy-L-arabinose transferase-like glycosyltransferase